MPANPTVSRGGVFTSEVTFLGDDDGLPVDPTVVQLEIRRGSSTVAGPFDYPDDGITRLSTGVYSYAYTVPDDAVLGEWAARWAYEIAGQSGYAVETFTVAAPGAAPLCTVDDVQARIGRTLTAAERARVATLIDDASAAIRLHTGRPFAAVTRTIRRMPHGGVVKLPHRGVADVTAVASIDGTALAYAWDGLNQVIVGLANQIDLAVLTTSRAVDITFTAGSDDVPQAVAAVCAQIAARAFGRPADQSGVQQETIAGYSYQVGSAAASGGVGILPDERRVLDRYRQVGGTAFVGLR